jgi:hypothetical protein
VLGYGAHLDPASVLVPALKQAQAIAKKGGRDIVFVASLTGTTQDPQGMAKQRQALVEAGVHMFPCNAWAARAAACIINQRPTSEASPVKLEIPDAVTKRATPAPPHESGAKHPTMFGGISAVNLGLAHFANPLHQLGYPVIQVDWKPPVSGDRDLGLVLAQLETDRLPAIKGPQKVDSIGEKIKTANEEAVKRILGANPALVDVQSAAEAIPGLGSRTILHAGPPITFERMCGPMQGAVIGAILFEGWAKDLEGARKLAAGGTIKFSPCHHFGAVGPMAGIIR